MKVLHRLINVVVFAVLLGLGILLIWTAASMDWWRAVAVCVERSGRLSVGSLGAAFVFLSLLLALTGMRRKEKERLLSFRNDEGRVSISTQAIADYITKLSTEFPSVIRMQPRVLPRGRMVDIAVDLRVKAGPQLHEVCEVLQRRVRETMANGLGISEVRRVEVSVREISSEHKDE